VWTCGDILLKGVYPEHFHIAWDKDATLEENMVWSNDSLHWNPRFVRACKTGTGILGFLKFFTKVRLGCDDKIIWIPTKSHGFEVKTYHWNQGQG
jgi:hypothetical protein